MTGVDTAALRESAQWLLDDWTEPAFARGPRHDVAIGCARGVLALLDECDRLRAELDELERECVSCPRCGADTSEDALTYSGCPLCQLERAEERRAHAEARAARYEQALREIAREYERWDDADREHPWDDVRAAWNAITTAEAALAAGSGEEQR